MNHPGRTLMIVTMIFCLLPGALIGEEEIPFGPDLVAGLAEAQRSDRPVVLYFSSPRCAWCRRFEMLTLTSNRVRSLADQFVWVKAPEAEMDVLMGRFSIGGWPTVVVLNKRGEEIARHAGYVDSEAFRAFLLKQVGTGASPGQTSNLAARLIQVAQAPIAAGQVPPELDEIVGLLARPDRANRETLLAALVQAGPALWPGLCELMADSRLAIRAAAAGALAYVSGHDLPFDPFADEAVRSEQLAAWRHWAAKRAGGSDVGPTSRSADSDGESDL